MNTYYVYIMSDRHRGTLYTGMTNNLEYRVSQHKLGATPGFTSMYSVHQLVYFEDTMDVLAAITREKQIKGWTRAKKIALIENTNPHWEDLSQPWFDHTLPAASPVHPTLPPDSFANDLIAAGECIRRSE